MPLLSERVDKLKLLFNKMILVSILLTCFLFGSSQAIETCYTRGECISSPFVSLPHSDTARDCHNACLAKEECSAFTWYTSTVCLGFVECIQFSNYTCSDCYSGLKNCLEPDCFKEGMCNGILLDLVHSENANACLNQCKSQSSCTWFTFDERYHECYLLDGCSSLDLSCSACQSGQVNCQDKPEYTKLMVIGGVGNGKVEVVDLSSIDSDCKDPGQLEKVATQAPSFMYKNQVHVCGGSDTKRNCFFYNPNSTEWIETTPMIEERFGFQIVNIGYEEFWFLGGRDADNQPKASTEIFKDGIFRLGPQMPIQLDYFCSVQINSTFAFIGGGNTFDPALNKTEYSDATFLINLQTMEWMELPRFNGTRYALSCGLFKDERGNDFIVAAGGRTSPGSTYRDDSEILDLRALTWTSGPDLPYPIAYSNLGVAQFSDHFIISGGRYDENNSHIEVGSLLKFDKSLEWRILAQTILPRYDHSVIPVPNEITDCN